MSYSSVFEDMLELVKLLADKENWGYFDDSGVPKGIGMYRDSWVSEIDHPMDIAQRILDNIEKH